MEVKADRTVKPWTDTGIVLRVNSGRTLKIC